jgi:hypothetical protein
MWSKAGIEAAKADFFAKQEQEELRRAQEEFDRIGNLKNSGVAKPYGVERKKSITKLLNRLNIHRYDDTGLNRFDSLRISSPGNSRTVHVKTIPTRDVSYEMDSSIMYAPDPPELDQFEIPIHKPPYGGKKRKSKRMKSRYRKKYKGTRNNKTRRYRK